MRAFGAFVAELEGLLDETLSNPKSTTVGPKVDAALDGRAAFPVTPYDSMEAGLTVMAIDKAMEEKRVVECGAMWAAYDAARGVR